MTTETPAADQKKVRVGVIGIGFITLGKHLPGLLANPEKADIVALCDFEDEKMAKAVEMFPSLADVSTTNDWHDLVDNPDIDAIHVCTWNVSHAEITVAALKAGKHVICEKPMAINAAEAKQMLDAAKETGKILTIGYQNRFRDDTQFVRKAVDEGKLGEIYMTRAHAVRRRGVPTWGVFTDKEKQGGGPLIDIGTHALDLALWYMDNYEVHSVTGRVFDKLRDKPEGNAMGPWDPETMDVEDSANGYIVMKNGATVYLEAAWALNDMKPREAAVTLMGTDGGAEIEADSGVYSATLNTIVGDQMTITKPGGAGGFFGAGGAAGAAQLAAGREAEQWLDAILDGGKPLVDPAQAIVVTQILEAIYESAKTGKTIYFDEA